MPAEQNSLLLERVTHKTQFRAISFHHTVSNPKTELVLYLHWHSEAEFLFLEKGEAIFKIEEQEFYLHAGEAIFIPPDLLHSAKGINESGCEFYAIVFSLSYLFDSCANPQFTRYLQPVINYGTRCTLHLIPGVPWQKDILEMLKRMYEESHKVPEYWELQMYGMLLTVWQGLYNNYLSGFETDCHYKKLSEQLSETLRYIHDSYGEDISLNELAALSNMSEGQFCRLFKKLTGFTPFGYLNRYRIIKSCKYLTGTNKKITEIAALCGFNNISYYNREFIRYIRITPSAYRKGNLNS
ncbi:AraC family transcriptional regulator [Anaerocolumna sp. MB42-C2]|uniref:AraC family transcriptional regulator n=1 Tax=Anaerocolumna sp. MB42-C2 TaxID=3070997 RepID=UPI0027E10C83|nr:AraC family transcriptional regulator [Anaerocolumna sp. MB42-C2]WMJ86567.1 AraC family transcriptional regulator [Anaerocolumna sp. MB42-C2]